jgi:hypothetical protein
MLVGYARTSTAADQIAGLDAQARELKAAGCTKLFSDPTQRGVGLVIQSMGLDTRNGSNPTACLMLTILVDLEREIMLERHARHRQGQS